MKFQYFDHLVQRTDSLSKTLMLGKIEGERRREENNVLFSIIMNTNKIIPQPKVYNIDGNYHLRIESPVYVRCRIQHAWGWCMVMTQRDIVGREVGGRFRIGNSCTPVADSCQCMVKPIQYCKAK